MPAVTGSSTSGSLSPRLSWISGGWLDRHQTQHRGGVATAGRLMARGWEGAIIASYLAVAQIGLVRGPLARWCPSTGSSSYSGRLVMRLNGVWPSREVTASPRRPSSSHVRRWCCTRRGGRDRLAAAHRGLAPDREGRRGRARGRPHGQPLSRRRSAGRAVALTDRALDSGRQLGWADLGDWASSLGVMHRLHRLIRRTDPDVVAGDA